MNKFNTLLIVFICIAFTSQGQDKKASVTFDGTDDYILIPHDASLNLGTSAFTFEAWITLPPTATASSAMIISKKGQTGTALDGFLFGLKDGKVVIELEGVAFIPGFGGGGGGLGVRARDLRDGSCHHVAWVLEKGGVQDTVMAYQDGDFVRKTRKGTGSTPLNISNLEDVWIGWSEDFNTPDLYQFQGEIKEVRIWNVTRTAAQIADSRVHLKGNEPGLVAYWRLNENTGTSVYDCGPDGNTGELKNGAIWKNFICDNMDAPNNCNSVVTGIKSEGLNPSIAFYPNPVVNEIRLEAPGEIKMDRIMIFDLNGRSVLNSQWDGKDALNLSNLQGGTYLIQLSNNEQILYKSVLIKE